MSRAAALTSLLLLPACVGPDVEICRDVITRVCLEPVCSSASTKLNVNDTGCALALQRGPVDARAGRGLQRQEFQTGVLTRSGGHSVLWAQLRNEGLPTAPDAALDADCVLAGQALEVADRERRPVVIATTNVGHLSRIVDARAWRDIS